MKAYTLFEKLAVKSIELVIGLIWVSVVIVTAMLTRTLRSSSVQNEADVYAIANVYFRYGEQAMLIAQDPYNVSRLRDTNAWDKLGQIETIDDPRVFQVVTYLNCGSRIGLETNCWVIDLGHPKTENIVRWITLKDK